MVLSMRLIERGVAIRNKEFVFSLWSLNNFTSICRVSSEYQQPLWPRSLELHQCEWTWMYFHNLSFQLVSLKRNWTNIWSCFRITVGYFYCGSAMVGFKAYAFQISIKSPRSWKNVEHISDWVEQELEDSSQKVL